MAADGARTGRHLRRVVTHLFDTSAILAQYFDESGADRVQDLLSDPGVRSGVSVVTLYEIYTAVLHRSGSDAIATEAVQAVREAVGEIAQVSEAVLAQAFDLRRSSSARIALADVLIAATADSLHATLVHRDPHFDALPPQRPKREKLPEK